jgi:DNA-binding SARP family transcriptional activator
MSADTVLARSLTSGCPPHLSLMRGFALHVDAEPVLLAQNAQRLIAFLALRDRPQRRQTVAAALWTDTTEDRAAANLRTALWKLADLRDRLVHTLGQYLRLAPEVEVDVNRLVTRNRVLIEPSSDLTIDMSADVGDLSADLLPDWDEDWILFERERLRQLRVHALEALCRRLVAAGRFAEAVDAGLSAVEFEPLRESAQRVLIEVHLAEGNVSEARRQFERYRNLLWDEMGLLPTMALWSLVGMGSPEAR